MVGAVCAMCPVVPGCVRVCVYWGQWYHLYQCVYFLCFTCQCEVGRDVLLWRREFCGFCIKSVIWGCFMVVFVLVLWPWPVWCGGSLGGVVLC